MISISGNPKLPGTVEFSPSAVTLLETFPPTVDSLAAARVCGKALGWAFGDYPKDEGLPSNIKTAFAVTEGIRMPNDTLMSFFNGITLGMEAKLRVVQNVIAIERLRAIPPDVKEALLAEISRRQIETVRELTVFAKGASNE